jgi:predicted DsbA family dithiol-disulfide isomerase
MRSPRTTHTGADAAPVRGDEGGVVRLVSGPSVTGSLSRAPVRIEVWSDIQCVWCYIGHARWVKALAQVDIPTTLVHRSFALQPEAPDDFDAQTYLRAHRGLSETDQQQLFDKMKQTAAADSLAYEPSRIRPTNSRAALELLHHAASVGRQQPLLERLYRAYFAQGRHIGRPGELVALAAEAGMDPDDARRALAEGSHARDVDLDRAQARALGIRSVPFTVVNNRYAISGAQSPESLTGLLTRFAPARPQDA